MEEYVSTFLTTPLFKLERHILAVVARKPSSDTNVDELALGQTTVFSAWSVEERVSNQLVLRDFLGRTRSWLMIQPRETSTSTATRLYFGSAVVPLSRSATGKASFGFSFHALYGFHRLYSKALMHSAQSRLSKVTP